MHGCSRAFARRHLPSRLRIDFRSFLSKKLRRAWSEINSSGLHHSFDESPDDHECPDAADDHFDELRQRLNRILEDIQSRDGSSRILEIVRLRQCSRAFRSIATELGVSEKTIRNHFKRLKIQANNNKN